jgi:drug/metabolite transporter (DMT)-like permease
MWIVYALAAAVIWGVSYAASGRVIARGVSPLSFFLCFGVFSTLAAGAALAVTGRLTAVAAEVRGLGPDVVWFLVAVVASAAGALLIYMAIGEKNATLASLIEISYPFFVAIFAWAFFRETHFTWPTVFGGLLILGGVAVVFFSNRH